MCPYKTVTDVSGHTTKKNPYTHKCKLIVKKGMAGATGNLYCGLHEYQEMFFLLHFLRPNDLFVDIGANIGSYSILSAAHIGCDTISIEPVPSTFNHLIDNIRINGIKEKIEALNIALGAQEGTIAFTNNMGTGNTSKIRRILIKAARVC
jgi:hypothetical protein